LPVFPQQIGIDKNRSNLVENNKWQQKNYSVNRPARPLGTLHKVKQLTDAVPVFIIFHSAGYFFLKLFCRRILKFS
jgi:hypothetical protein